MKILHYLCPVMLQITIVCIIAAVLNNTADGMTGYNSAAGIVLIAAGGLSSALWACVYQIRHNGKSIGDIAKDFFRFKADIKVYLLAAGFILLDFLPAFFGGPINTVWNMMIIFLKSIVFGGIEETAWRYTFQPHLEKNMPYIAATLITFVFWGIWHFMFFYIDGSISVVDPVPFLTGLLVNCFILSALYNYGRNLWICVMTHSLINTFSQTFSDGTAPVFIGIMLKAVIIVSAVFISRKSRNKSPDGHTA